MTRTSKAFAEANKYADRRRYSHIIDSYLRDCYARRTAARVSELAQLLDTATPYLSRVIPQLFDKTLHELLRGKQLEEAKRLLRTTPLLVREIAVASAFGTPATFHRAFRRAYGMTPEQYRKRLREVKK